MKKNLSKKAKTFIILGSVAILLFVTLMVYFFGAKYPEFNQVSAKEFEIPGLETSFVPQGLDYDSTSDKFVVCGYMGDGSASRIYIVDAKTGIAEKYVTLTTDLQDYTGHAGGIAIDYPYAFICGDGFLYRFNYENLLLTENGGKLEVMDSFETHNGADSVCIIDGKLVVVEFYREEDYETNPAHKISIGNETHRAISFVYEIDHSKTAGIKPTVLYGISTPDQVQGMSLNKDGNLILSTSYGLSNSKLYVYESFVGKEFNAEAFCAGALTKVYFLSEEDLIKEYDKVPCMSEEMVLVDDKVYILFESKCKKYRLFTRTRIDSVYSMSI